MQDKEFQLLWVAADLGDSEAMYDLGFLAYRARNRKISKCRYPLDKPYATADWLGTPSTWWQKASDLGNPSATQGLIFLSKEAGDKKGVLFWSQKASELGNGKIAIGRAHLGRDLYGISIHARQSGKWKLAKSYSQKAADLGDADAMDHLGDLASAAYRASTRQRWRKKHLEQAKFWWHRAAYLDNPRAMYSLGVLANTARDWESAKSWWQKAADRGHFDAEQALRDPKSHLMATSNLSYEAAADLMALSWLSNLNDLSNSDKTEGPGNSG